VGRADVMDFISYQIEENQGKKRIRPGADEEE
jgi:hypothetical protein